MAGRAQLVRPPYVDPTTNIIYDTDRPEYEGWLTKQSMWLKVRLFCFVSFVLLFLPRLGSLHVVFVCVVVVVATVFFLWKHITFRKQEERPSLSSETGYHNSPPTITFGFLFSLYPNKIFISSVDLPSPHWEYGSSFSFICFVILIHSFIAFTIIIVVINDDNNNNIGSGA